jgi:hypothetical protein
MEDIEAHLSDALPALEDLIELASKRVDPDNAAATIAKARALLSSVSAKIGEAQRRLDN